MIFVTPAENKIQTSEDLLIQTSLYSTTSGQKLHSAPLRFSSRKGNWILNQRLKSDLLNLVVLTIKHAHLAGLQPLTLRQLLAVISIPVFNRSVSTQVQV